MDRAQQVNCGVIVPEQPDRGVGLIGLDDGGRRLLTGGLRLLRARGVISVQERASYMGRVRDLARGSCEAYMAKEKDRWTEAYPGWSA